jgi:tetraacyldisaccharide 4'-kinase
VDKDRHRAAEVGDEPLLLARVAPTIVARDRPDGAQAALAKRASAIVMDDGFQNPSLENDVAMLVVDAARGIGNGRVLPAGPLRAPLPVQLERANAMVLVGRGIGASEFAAEARARGIAVFSAQLVPEANVVAALKGSRILAFAGIGDPAKFFATLGQSGLAVAQVRSFADHHRYSQREAKALCEEAARDDLALVTTEKDLVRLQGEDALSELCGRTRALPVALTFDDEAAFRTFLVGRLSGARRT